MIDGRGLPLLPESPPFLLGDLKLPLTLGGLGPSQPLPSRGPRWLFRAAWPCLPPRALTLTPFTFPCPHPPTPGHFQDQEGNEGAFVVSCAGGIGLD